MAVGAIEPQFYAELRRLTGLTEDADLDAQMSVSDWPALKEKLAVVFRTRTQAEWTALFDGTDACVSPVLSMTDAPTYPHNQVRGTFMEVDGVQQPAPAPRFSATPATTPRMSSGDNGADTETVLESIGYNKDRIASLKQAGVLG
jgi:alpha-methylacyl-CoA racemase